MPEASVEVVRRAIAAYNRRDFETLRAINHSDVEVDWSASRGLDARVYTGISEVLGLFRSFFDTFEQVEIEPERFVECGDVLVVPNVAHIRGRDGIEAIARSALVFEVHDGRIARLCLYQETHEALTAVGLSTSE